MGPVESPISKVKKKFRSRLLLGLKILNYYKKKLQICLKILKFLFKIKLTVDVDPVNFT